jgi:endoribonuclease L-PSP, putative
MKTTIITDKAPTTIGPYSQAVKIGGLMFCSGMLPINPKSSVMPEGIQAQTKQVLENIKGLLESQGRSMEDVVKTTIFLNNMDDFVDMNHIYELFFVAPFPARSTVEVARLPKDALIEIETIVMME